MAIPRIPLSDDGGGRKCREMNTIDYKDKIISSFAETICKKISNKVIRNLQKMNEVMLSGDDTGLKNVWDEICVQVRFQHSIYWGFYLELIDTIIYDELEKLDSASKQAIWLQTEEGRDFTYNYEDYEDNEREEIQYINDGDIIDYINQCYILSAADNWTNKRIEEYLDKSYE